MCRAHGNTAHEIPPLTDRRLVCCPDEPGQEGPGCVISVKCNWMHIAIDQLICAAGNRGLTPLGLSKDDLLRRACVNIGSWQHRVTLLAHANGHMHSFIRRPTATLSRWPSAIVSYSCAEELCAFWDFAVALLEYIFKCQWLSRPFWKPNKQIKYCSYPRRYLTWTSGWPSHWKWSHNLLAFKHNGHSPPANRMAAENRSGVSSHFFLLSY